MDSSSIKRFVLCFGLCTVLIVCSDCRPASVPGTVTRSKVRNFRFFARIANPCEIGPVASPPQVSTTASSTSSDSDAANAMGSSSSRLQFYQSIALSLELVLQKLAVLEAADPSLPECNGITLNSLPSTPPLDNLNAAEAIKQTYKTGIYLATHFHLVTMDRQLSRTSEDNQPDEQLEDEVPNWRFRKCGNESESMPTNLEEVTTQLESFLCTVLTSATDEQRASFREPFNLLERTGLYRYHTSCSMLQTRDCLVLREAKQATSLILRKFKTLITAEAELVANGGSDVRSDTNNEDDMMDNSL